MNKYLKAFAENQPITQVIEAVRALILNQPLHNHGWLAVAWSLGLLAVAVPTATYLFARKSS
jgi:ABC-2 type transport system permease protein